MKTFFDEIDRAALIRFQTMCEHKTLYRRLGKDLEHEEARCMDCGKRFSDHPSSLYPVPKGGEKMIETLYAVEFILVATPSVLILLFDSDVMYK